MPAELYCVPLGGDMSSQLPLFSSAVSIPVGQVSEFLWGLEAEIEATEKVVVSVSERLAYLRRLRDSVRSAAFSGFEKVSGLSS